MMAVAPERISIKRKRSEVPVEHLIYQSKKQRTTDHVFVRLNPNQNPVVLQNSNATSHEPYNHSSKVPAIRATQPGDEIRDFQRYKATQEQRDKLANGEIKVLPTGVDHTTARRFHLTRDLSMTARKEQNIELSKQKSSIRPHLATFVEKQRYDHSKAPPYLREPTDRAIRSTDKSKELLPDQILSDEQSVERKDIASFSKPSPVKDVSDELAEELLAFALELDPEAKAAYEADPANRRQPDRFDAMLVDDPNDYIFETYVRVEQNSIPSLSTKLEPESYGVLVIDEEDEELWEQYLRDEDGEDDEWDSEDGDSNAEDNPRNEYPDEELSEDDEYGTNLYKYRRYGSDNEQYDDDY